jgi:N-acetylglucosamine malate deacetylase 1
VTLIASGCRILCVAPHPDDIEFGVGATLHRHRHHCKISGLVLSDRFASRGERNNREEQRQAFEILGIGSANVRFVDDDPTCHLLPVRFFGTQENRDLIRQYIMREVETVCPDIIFIPAITETMQDHQAVSEEVVRVVRGDCSILGYEVPKHNRNFRPNAFVSVDERDLSAKIAAVGVYADFTTRYYFGSEQIRSLAVIRALDAGRQGLVEAFEVYRVYVPL